MGNGRLLWGYLTTIFRLNASTGLNWLGILKFLWYRRQIEDESLRLLTYRRKMVPLALIYLGMQGGIQRNPG